MAEEGIYFSFGGGEVRRIDVAAVVYGLSPAEKLVAGHVAAGPDRESPSDAV